MENMGQVLRSITLDLELIKTPTMSTSEFSLFWRAWNYARTHSTWDIRDPFVVEVSNKQAKDQKICHDIFEEHQLSTIKLVPRLYIDPAHFNGWQREFVEWHNRWDIDSWPKILYLTGESECGKSKFFEHFYGKLI